MKAIVLTRGRIATVNDEDFDRCNQFKWYAAKRGKTYYGAHHTPRKNGKRTIEYLHQFILGIKGADHRDGDGLNNQRENLRPATSQQNRRGFRRKARGTTSQYRGVYRDAFRQLWRARIVVDSKDVYIGNFVSEIAAARAYDAAAKRLFGEFASPNFP